MILSLKKNVERICNEVIIQNKLNEFILKLPDKSTIKSIYAIIINTFPEYYDLKYIIDTNIYNTTRLSVILAIISKTYTYQYNEKSVFPSDTIVDYNLSILAKYNSTFKKKEISINHVIPDAWFFNYSF